MIHAILIGICNANSTHTDLVFVCYPNSWLQVRQRTKAEARNLIFCKKREKIKWISHTCLDVQYYCFHQLVNILTSVAESIHLACRTLFEIAVTSCRPYGPSLPAGVRFAKHPLIFIGLNALFKNPRMLSSMKCKLDAKNLAKCLF